MLNRLLFAPGADAFLPIPNLLFFTLPLPTIQDGPMSSDEIWIGWFEGEGLKTMN